MHSSKSIYKIKENDENNYKGEREDLEVKKIGKQGLCAYFATLHGIIYVFLLLIFMHRHRSSFYVNLNLVIFLPLKLNIKIDLSYIVG